MNPPLRVEITENARRHIAAAATWWSENRPAAPGAVLEELDHVLGLLCVQSEMGTRARGAGLLGVRRVALPRIRYFLYYRVTDNILQVLALWHASRGQGPSL